MRPRDALFDECKQHWVTLRRETDSEGLSAKKAASLRLLLTHTHSRKALVRHEDTCASVCLFVVCWRSILHDWHEAKWVGKVMCGCVHDSCIVIHELNLLRIYSVEQVVNVMHAR